MQLGGPMGAEYWMEQHNHVLKFSFSILRLFLIISFAYCCCEQASHEGTSVTHTEDLDLNLRDIHS